MGCFLGCFGLSSKRKRRRPANRVQPGDQKFGSYEPLDSVSANVDVLEEPIERDSELSKKPKETLNYKIRKKVSFNLNVQTYEPIPSEESSDHLWDIDNEEETEEETSQNQAQSLLSEGDSMASYPPTYRYRNCIDSYDEEDEIAYDDSDLDDLDDYDDEGSGDVYDVRISQQVFFEEFNSLSVTAEKNESLPTSADSKEGGLRSLGMAAGARDRSHYVHSVLNPVENLSQWKAVKATGVLPQEKLQRKENIIALEQQPQKKFGDIAVDTSLSNWLVSSAKYQPKTEFIIKGSFDKNTCSFRNREDMPILDITNL